MRKAAEILAEETETPAVAIRVAHSLEVGIGPDRLLQQMAQQEAVRDAVLLGRPDGAEPSGRWIRARRQVLGRPRPSTAAFARVRIPID